VNLPAAVALRTYSGKTQSFDAKPEMVNALLKLLANDSVPFAILRLTLHSRD